MVFYTSVVYRTDFIFHTADDTLFSIFLYGVRLYRIGLHPELAVGRIFFELYFRHKERRGISEIYFRGI